MLQVLKYDKKESGDAHFSIISPLESLRFFAKWIGYLILFAYSTVFIASVEPFVRSKFELWIYLIGVILTVFILIRLCNHLIKYIQYNKSSILVQTNKIICTHRSGNIEINTRSLKSIRVNLFGNIVFRGDKNVSFPLMLLHEKDRESLLSYFEDQSQNRIHVLKKIYEFFTSLLIAFILAMHIREYIIQSYYIPTGSMEDTLMIGDHLLVERITYGPIIPKMPGMDKEIHLKFLGLRDIKRNDIVIFKPPNESEKDYVKRCIALPGDELHIKDNSVYLNGKKLEEPFIKGVTNYDYFREKRLEGIVPEDYIAVLGDNRENSSDGRAFGYLPIERIKGRAFVMYWNTRNIMNFDFSRFGFIR